jgi:D-alanyl-D-alanine carboxypeptidase/D-alanyl-D-alanine-endopeptidase (penicillin-binding protein 4)
MMLAAGGKGVIGQLIGQQAIESAAAARGRAAQGATRLARHLIGAGLALLAAVAAPVHAADALPPELARALTQSQLPSSAVSVVVEELEGGRRLAALNPGTPRNPASVMKLVTTYSALEGLGPAFTWRTELLALPQHWPGPDGALRGPLYLRASGDPILRMEDVWSMLRDLRLHGVTRLPELVVDRSLFGDVRIDTGAFDGDAARPYNASPDTWMVGFGAIRLMFLPDRAQRRWRVVTDPVLPNVRIEGAPVWSDVACPGSPSVQADPVVDARGVTLRLSGTVSGDCGEFSIYRIALPQADHASAVLRKLWEEMGGTIDGPVRVGTVPAGVMPLASHESPALAEVIRDINKRSNNVMARQLLLTLGAANGQGGATQRDGAAAVHSVLLAHGMEFPELVVDNGSGLSRNGRVSVDSLAKLLGTAYRSPVMPEFMSSLSISGTDGTVRRRLRGSSTMGMAHLKTGTLRDVRAIAGYVLASSGKRYLVVGIVNHEQAANAGPFLDALVAWVAAK